MKKKILWLAILSGLLISLDQLLKIYIHTHFSIGESNVIIHDFFNITYVTNKGAAFGFLSKSQETFRNIFFLLMPPTAMLVILWVLKTVKESDSLQIAALSSVFAGAIGNYIDRIRYGSVIDFLDFHKTIGEKLYSWPAFNVADMAIVFGVGILIVILMKERKTKTTSLI